MGHGLREPVTRLRTDDTAEGDRPEDQRMVVAELGALLLVVQVDVGVDRAVRLLMGLAHGYLPDPSACSSAPSIR
jgi:hypothetical protein